MDLTPYLSQLREDLTTAASAGNEQTRHTAAVLGAALEPAARLAIMNALSDLAAEVTAALDGRVAEVRLDGRDVRVAVSLPPGTAADAPGPHATGAHATGRHTTGSHATGPHATGPHAERAGATGSRTPLEPDAATLGDASGDIRRMTLRLIDQLKAQAEHAAAQQGVSLNTWVSQAVAGALRGEPWNEPQWGPGERRGRNRVQGWVQG
jgi:HicB family